MTRLGHSRDWALTQGRSQTGPAAFLAGFCEALREAGVPIDRATLGAPLLHPIAQSNFASWSVKDGGHETWLVWTPENLERIRNSPIYQVYEGGRAERFDLSSATDSKRFAITRELAEQGYREYATFALPFSDGTFKVFTWATHDAAGFTDEHLAQLHAALPALATVLETFVLRRTAETLLDTYVGGRAGKRVLDGQIHRGDGSRIPAVVLFSDIRGFTAMSAALPEIELMERLNCYFGAVSDKVAAQNGEILKFIGDAVLAIFPYQDDAAKIVAKAEEATAEILAARQADGWPDDLEFGIGLHLGEVFYGNIGGAKRLDFTVIGEAVNTASRIESLCSRLSEPCLVSNQIRDVSAREYRDCGEHKLKGLAGPIRVFAPLH